MLRLRFTANVGFLAAVLAVLLHFFWVLPMINAAQTTVPAAAPWSTGSDMLSYGVSIEEGVTPAK